MRSKFKWIFTLLIAFSVQFSFAQQKTVTGSVTDELGPVAGANVVNQSSKAGTVTDFDGNFSVSAKKGDVLVVSFAGTTQSVTVADASTYNVVLKVVSLQEVVLGGYRTVTKKAAVAAITTVDSKSIENRPNASFMNTLQGQVAGLNIASGNGQPGAKSTVIIRGLGTINGSSDPLYVIDGFPTNSDNFRSLNPNDIESMSVLKDASATSIYGNRGANGVILITTKQGGSGEAGKPVIRYSTSTGLVELQRTKYNFANSAQQLQLQNDYDGSPSINGATGLPYTADVNTDWVDFFFRTARTTRHDLSIETSGKRLKSYTSVGYLDNQGLLVNTSLKRFTFRNNLTGSSEDNKFKFATNVGFGFTKNNETVGLGTGGINRNMILGATLSLPFISPDEYISSANVLDLYGASGNLQYTPLFLVDKLYTFENVNEEFRLNTSADLSYKLNEYFTLKSRTGAETISVRNVQSEFPGSVNALLFQGSDEFAGYEDINNRREFYFSQYYGLDFSKKITDKQTIGASVNAEYYFGQLQANNARQNGLDPRFYVPGTGAGYVGDLSSDDSYVPNISATKLKNNLISYFATLDYDYDGRYGLTATYRRDGSSRFAEDYRWGGFWSVGGRWNIDAESFMANQNLFQVLKLRLSYGTTGNQRVLGGTSFSGLNPQLYANTYGISAAAANTYNGGAVSFVNFGYDKLSWETTATANIGLDFEMLKARLRGNLDVYNKRTTDLFNGDPVSPIVGTVNLNLNSDIVVENKGVELNLAYDLVKNQDFRFTIRGNGAYNKNEVSNIGTSNGKIINGNTVLQNGQTVNEFYLYPYVGVNQLNGNLLFQTANGTASEVPLVDADRFATGKSYIPVYIGGFGFNADYKGFFASTDFSFTQKVYRFDFDLAGLYDPDAMSQFVVSSDLLNAWTPANTNTDVPSLTANNYGSQDNSDRFLKDASYVRLRNLQVGYNVPTKFLKGTFISNASIMLQGENLFTVTKWKGFDPESNRAGDQGQYPTPKMYSLSLDLKF